MAATSMAAALAASLPAPQAASTPTAPTYEAIPASMSKVVDIEAEIPLTSVQIDGLVSALEDKVSLMMLMIFDSQGCDQNYQTWS